MRGQGRRRGRAVRMSSEREGGVVEADRIGVCLES